MMKIRADKKALLDAILPAMCALSNKTVLPMLEFILLKAENGMLTVTGYDMSKGVKSEIPVSVEEEGCILLDAGKLSSIIRALPEDRVELSVNEKLKTFINCGKSHFEIVGMSAEGYPSLPELLGDRSFKIEKGVMKRLCQQVLSSVAYDDKKAVLTGVSFELDGNTMTVVSCDAFRLSIRREKVHSDEVMKFIVPGRTLTDLVKLLDDSDEIITVELTGKHIIIHFGDLYFFSRLLEGEYIDYMKSIPKEHHYEVKCRLDDIIDCLERVSLVIDERAKTPVRLEVAPGGLLVNCEAANSKISDEVVAETEGVDLVIGFNNHYLLDALRGAAMSGDEEVVLRMNSPLIGMSIQPVDHDSYFYLVLPVRLSQ